MKQNKFSFQTLVFLFTMVFFLSGYAQQDPLTGTVTSSDGMPIPGVNIIQKGTSNGVVTDFDGIYSIVLREDAEQVLVFSFVGFESKEEAVNNRSSINVTLSNGGTLDEIVVIGYGTQKRRDITGAISSISAEDFPDAPPVAPEQILQGKVTGVNIVQNSGQPGAASSVQIRGISSISAGNNPLYVVDGVPLQFGSANNTVALGGQGGTSAFSSEVSNPLNIINPADIQSIDVLKDASATAIYGSRGANGVIMITTKNKEGLGETFSYDN